MALVSLHFFSETLGMQSEAYVILPQNHSRGEIGVSNKTDSEKYKVLYLLHGLSDDHTIWMRRTSIERYAGDYGICVVMPCGHRSFYTDMKYGADYYTYITKELPARITEFFNVSDKREDTFIAGLSMGGYGALKAALREPDKYAKAAGLSAVCDINEFCQATTKLGISIFGETLSAPDEDDLFKLVSYHKDDGVKPDIYIGIGRQDGLYEQNQIFKQFLSENNYNVTYRESDGAHNWDFWDEYIKYVLQWMFGGH